MASVSPGQQTREFCCLVFVGGFQQIPKPLDLLGRSLPLGIKGYAGKIQDNIEVIHFYAIPYQYMSIIGFIMPQGALLCNTATKYVISEDKYAVVVWG
jgi:hypothetical protein